MLLVVSSILAAAPAYDYWINNNDHYRIQGVTDLITSNGYAGETNGVIPAGSGAPYITFQKLVLESRVWRSSGTNCFLGQKLYAEINTGPHFNKWSVRHTFLNYAGNPNYVHSKHKLVDTRATNSAGDPPNAFFSEYSAGSPNPSSKTKYQGSQVGC